MPLFQCHRWLNGLGPVSEYALLFGIHGCSVKVFPRWIAALKGKATPSPAPQAAASAPLPAAWLLSDSEDERDQAVGGNGEPAPAAPAAPGDQEKEMDWAASNLAQQSNAMRVGRSVFAAGCARCGPHHTRALPSHDALLWSG